MLIAIAGKKTDTENYVRYVSDAGHTPLVTLNPGDITGCDALLLPGGGDITPAFFGEKNHGSRFWASARACSSSMWGWAEP